MDIVEHFEDNLNVNLSNNVAVLAFIKEATAAHAALKAKYPDAANGFNDPQDPINIPDSEKTDEWINSKKSWSNIFKRSFESVKK